MTETPMVLLEGFSDLAGKNVRAEGSGDETFLCVCLQQGDVSASAWITQDGAAEMESEMERMGWVCELVPVDRVVTAPGGDTPA